MNMRRLVEGQAIATLLMGAIIAVYAAFLNGTSLWLISSARGATAVVLALGIAASAASAWGFRSRAQQQEFRGGAYIIGSIALLAVVIGLIIGSTVALSIFVVGMFALWLIATVWSASSIRGGELVHDGGRVIPFQERASGRGHGGEEPEDRHYG